MTAKTGRAFTFVEVIQRKMKTLGYIKIKRINIQILLSGMLLAAGLLWIIASPEHCEGSDYTPLKQNISSESDGTRVFLCAKTDTTVKFINIIGVSVAPEKELSGKECYSGLDEVLVREMDVSKKQWNEYDGDEIKPILKKDVKTC